MHKQYINNVKFKHQNENCSIFEKVGKNSAEPKKKISKEYEAIRELVTGHQNTSQTKKDNIKINII